MNRSEDPATSLDSLDVFKWKSVRLAALGTFEKARGGTKEDNQDSGVPVVRYGDLYTRFGLTIRESASFVSEEDSTRYTPLPTRSLVIAASGESAEDIGKSALSLLPQPAVVGGDAIVFRPNELVHPMFLAYFLDSQPARAAKAVRATGFTVVHITVGRLKTIQVPLPSLEEQRAIADFLDQETAMIDDVIAEQHRLIDLLSERRQAVVDSVITSGLDPSATFKDSGIAWIGKVPDHWEIRPLWTMFKRTKDVDHPDEQMLSVFRDFGVIPKDSRENNNQTAENRSIYQLVHPGWLVANRMKAWQGSVGISTHRGIVSGHYICFEPRHDEDHGYLNWLFRSPRYTAGYGQISRGVRIGQAEIDNGDYRVLPVLVPPLSEQLRMDEHLRTQTQKIDELMLAAAQLANLARERRSALITAAVTGQLDVRKVAA